MNTCILLHWRRFFIKTAARCWKLGISTFRFVTWRKVRRFSLIWRRAQRGSGGDCLWCVFWNGCDSITVWWVINDCYCTMMAVKYEAGVHCTAEPHVQDARVQCCRLQSVRHRDAIIETLLDEPNVDYFYQYKRKLKSATQIWTRGVARNLFWEYKKFNEV